MKKKTNKKKSQTPLRLTILFFVIFLMFSALILRLGTVQIIYGDDYKREVERTEDVTVNNSVPRGRMYDRDGQVVVDNQALDSITYTRSQNTDTDEMLAVARKLATMIDPSTDKIRERDEKDFWLLIHPNQAKKKITKEDEQLFAEEKIDDKEVYQRQLDRITKKDLATLSKKDRKVLAIFREMNGAKTLTPQVIKNKDVTEKEIAIVSEHLDDLPGVNVTVDWERKYPYDKTLRSVLGGVSKSEQGLPQDKLDYYLARDYSRNDRVGTSYIESQYEDVLQGKKTKVKNITDKSGNVVDSKTISAGSQGKDLMLTIDIDLQEAVDQIVSDELKAKRSQGNTLMDRAFAIMTNPKTGEILAMSGKQFVKDEKTGKQEIQDYAAGNFTSSYVMGSVVKGATVLTGYQTGALRPNDVKLDTPLKIKGTPVKKSWKSMGYINDLTALKQSSNVYMFRTALDIAKAHYVPGKSIHIDPTAFDTMRYFYNEFGLGVPTGIDLPNEATGYIGPERGPGKLMDLAIGQYDTYTPLQLSQYISTIANGGDRIQPHIVKEIHEPSRDPKKMGPLIDSIQPTVLNTVDMKKEWIERVQTGFKKVMQEQGGTGYNAFHDASYNMAGKSGTAQGQYAGPKKNVKNKAEDVITLSAIGYAPADNPEVTIAVVVPWAYVGSSGHSMNMDIARKAMDTYFDLKEGKQTEKKEQE
ncbi:peptidoglycan D,D-transpeptidase FtsI family protein [Bacillus testis]|uniref:peptidoglycan D,D-transpeptidase FtsI family protein n=1 Tax=Bacillus testis TaxID=1622072 RepID=UPI00067F18AB|nr:penicillin-binding protein 2 [Bacillus testis]